MIRHNTILLALILTVPFVNFSLFTGSNLPLPYILVILLLPVVLLQQLKVPAMTFGKEDLLFLVFVILGFISYMINKDVYHGINGLRQIVNFTLTYLIYKFSLIVLFRADEDPEIILRRIFNLNTILQSVALAIFFIGYLNGPFQEIIIRIFNNAQNFSIGAVATEFPSARIFGFSPEPSFWSLFVVMNISLAFTIKRPSKIFISINLISLLLTFSRAGLFALVLVVMIKLFTGSVFQKSLVVVCVVLSLIFLMPYADPDTLMAVDSSFRQRIGSQLVALSTFHDHPFFGIGLGNFAQRAEALGLDYKDIFNLYLSLLVTAGTAGLMAFAGILYFIYRRISSQYLPPFFAVVFGWMTVGAYNLPYMWFIFAVLVYVSYRAVQQHNNLEPDGQR